MHLSDAYTRRHPQLNSDQKAEVVALPPFYSKECIFHLRKYRLEKTGIDSKNIKEHQRTDEIMGLFLTALASDLSPEELKKEKQQMVKIGRMGVSDRAVFLSSMLADRSRYVLFSDMNRIFKQVAMSKGGFTGKGVFGSMAYIVVEMKSGHQVKCPVQVEQYADALLEEVSKRCPELPVHSREAEQKLRAAAEEEKARYVDHLSAGAEATIEKLEDEKQLLERKPELYRNLAASAKQLRIVQRVNPSAKWVALVVMIMAICATVFGIVRVVQGGTTAIYIVFFGFAIIFTLAASRVLPNAQNNVEKVREANAGAITQMESALSDEELDVPARYAHPIVLDRMIRVIREGRAETAAEALDLVKKDLQALNSSVTVSQKEYDEVVEIKPMFLNCNYE